MEKFIRAAAIAACLGSAPMAASALTINGSFEDLSGDVKSTAGCVGCTQADLGTSGASWGVFASLPGWTTTAGKGIEVQKNTTIAAKDGDYYVELDSHPSPGSNSTMQQTLTLDAGLYELSFWYAPRVSGNPDGTNGIEFRVDTGLLAPQTIAGGGDVGTWVKYARTFEVLSTQDVKLVFSAVGKEETLGGFLDDIQLSKVPLPAAAWMLIAGVAGLGLFRRRQTA